MSNSQQQIPEGHPKVNTDPTLRCPFAGTAPSADAPLKYQNYLQIDTLLSLQSAAVSGGLHHHDEHMFIVIHQVFELWFRQIIRELTDCRDRLLKPTYTEELSIVYDRICRAQKIIEHATGAFDIMCTMNPIDFMEFRDFIGPASGFESLQMRQLECLIGLEDKQRIKCGNETYISRFDEKQMKMLGETTSLPSIKATVYSLLSKIEVPSAFKGVFLKAKRVCLEDQHRQWGTAEDIKNQLIDLELANVDNFLTAQDLTGEDAVALEELRNSVSRRRLSIIYLLSYKNDPKTEAIAKVIEKCTSFEHSLLLWRNEHARMAEFMIGRRMGTGGSSGVSYLDSTRHYRIFVDLWHARSVLLKASALPTLNEVVSMSEQQ